MLKLSENTTGSSFLNHSRVDSSIVGCLASQLHRNATLIWQSRQRKASMSIILINSSSHETRSPFLLTYRPLLFSTARRLRIARYMPQRRVCLCLCLSVCHTCALHQNRYSKVVAAISTEVRYKARRYGFPLPKDNGASRGLSATTAAELQVYFPGMQQT